MVPEWFVPMVCAYLGLWFLLAFISWKYAGRFKYKNLPHHDNILSNIFVENVFLSSNGYNIYNQNLHSFAFLDSYHLLL